MAKGQISIPELAVSVSERRVNGFRMHSLTLAPRAVITKVSARRVTLSTLLARPAYRLGSRNSTVVFADTGDVLDGLSLELVIGSLRNSSTV